MNTGSFIFGTIFAAILPPIKMPPVDMNLRAQLPVSAPKMLTKIASA